MKTGLRMERPNGNKLTGAHGTVKSSRPAGMVVVRWGSFVAITGVGKSSWPAGLPVAEACLCVGRGEVSSPVSLRRLEVVARVGGRLAARE
jgi:hypothetical protein